MSWWWWCYVQADHLQFSNVNSQKVISKLQYAHTIPFK